MESTAGPRTKRWARGREACWWWPDPRGSGTATKEPSRREERVILPVGVNFESKLVFFRYQDRADHRKMMLA